MRIEDLHRIVEHSEKNSIKFVGVSTDVVKKLIKVAEAAKAYKDYDGKKEYLELADALDELEGE